MISSLFAWFRARRRGTKLLLAAAGAMVALAVLYGAARTMQYAAASRTPASLFLPEEADVVVRVRNLATRWEAVKGSEFWKTLTRRIQKEPGLRKSLNEILAASGVPTVDELEDRRWLDRHPLVQEASILRFAGRDVAAALAGEQMCVATRLGWSDFLLLPALQLFPAAAGAERAEAGGVPVLKRGGLYISIQGAVVVASNDPAMLASALKRRGQDEESTGLARVTVKAEPLRPILRGFPLGGLLAVADVETCERIDVEVDVEGADLVVRAQAKGLKPLREEGAPVDTVRMIPEKGIGAVVANVETGAFWKWIRHVGDRNRRGNELDRFVRDNVRDFVEILDSNRFESEVVAKLDGPVSILLGATEGDDGKTYASAALYLRTSQSREAGEGLQRVIDAAMQLPQKNIKVIDEEEGGVTLRSFRYEPDLFKLNNYLSVAYAVAGDAVILANTRDFLVEILRCRANQSTLMATQLHFEQSLRRLQKLGMARVMSPGATASLYLHGPHLRQGLEGFYASLASKIVDTDAQKRLLRQELETNANKAGQPIRAAELDDAVQRVLAERIQDLEARLRSRARILDCLQWVAFQAEPSGDGLSLRLAIELK